MAKFSVKGNLMFDKISNELDIDFKRVGSLVLAFKDEDMKIIKDLYENGKKNGVKNLEVLHKEEVLKMEKNLNTKVIGGLYCPNTGILSPWEFTIALAENSVNNGVNLMLNNKVIDIKKYKDYFNVATDKTNINSRYVINCAGLYADGINNMISKNKFKILPRRGEYFILDKEVGDLVNSVIFQTPDKMGKGVIVAPTIHGNIIIGPNAENIMSKESLETSINGLKLVKEMAIKSVPDIPFNKVITSFSGLRARCHIDDFYIEESKDIKGFINVAGIKSPGLTSSPAIAEYVVKLLKDIDGNIIENENFNPNRNKIINLKDLNDDEKSELIKADPRYGNIVCRCEEITEGEIVDCIKRGIGAKNLDGIKRRVRPGSGRCQGGFCQWKVIEILARELEKPNESILKDTNDSYILIGKTNKGDGYEKI